MMRSTRSTLKVMVRSALRTPSISCCSGPLALTVTGSPGLGEPSCLEKSLTLMPRIMPSPFLSAAGAGHGAVAGEVVAGLGGFAALEGALVDGDLAELILDGLVGDVEQRALDLDALEGGELELGHDLDFDVEDQSGR